IVSNAKDVFPLPDTPVKTTILFLGISRLMFFKLCCLAPLIFIYSIKYSRRFYPVVKEVYTLNSNEEIQKIRITQFPPKNYPDLFVLQIKQLNLALQI